MVATKPITQLATASSVGDDDLFLLIDQTTNPSIPTGKKLGALVLKEYIQDIAGLLISDSATIDVTYTDGSNTLTLDVKANTSTQKIEVRDAGSLVSTRKGINLVDGALITVTVADNVGQDRADITIASTAIGAVTTLTGTGTVYNVVKQVVTEGNGSKTIEARGLKSLSNAIVLALADTNNVISVDLDEGQIAINDLDTSNPLDIAGGGTGAADAPTARSNLGAAASGANADITSITGLTTALAVNQGGTGANTANAGLTNLGGVFTAANVGVGGVGLFRQKFLTGGTNRLEFRNLNAGTGGYVTVTLDSGNNEVDINVNPDAILSAATQNVNLNGYSITGLGEPTASTDAATKAYVDTTAQAGNGNTEAGTGLNKVGATINLADTAVTPGSYGSSSAVATFTVDQQGRLTAAGSTSIQAGSTSQAGLLQLTDSFASTSITTAATPNAVKSAYDLAATKLNSSAVSAFGLTLIDDADASAARTTLGAAALNSPTFTGTPAGPTAAVNTNTTQLATTAFVLAQIANDAPTKTGTGASGTWPISITGTAGNSSQLGGVAAASYALLASPTFTGTPAGPTAVVNTNTTQLATTAFVLAQIANDAPTKTGGGASGNWGINITGNAATATNASQLGGVGSASYALLASPTFTGTPAAPTAAVNTNTTQLATTAFVQTQIAARFTRGVTAVAALDIDCSLGNYFTKTINGASTFTFSNPPSTGTAYAFTLELTHTSGTITWPTSVKWPADTAPTLTTGKTHLFMFITDDGGTRWRGAALADYTN